MDALLQAPVTCCMNKAGAVVGTTTTFSFTANPLVMVLKGDYFTKATVTNGATPTSDFNTSLPFVGVPANFGCAFLLGYDVGGTLRVTQGPLQALDTSGNFILAPQLPTVPDTVCPFARLIVKCGATASTWTFGTSNLSGPPTGVTFSFTDMFCLPARPQVT